MFEVINETKEKIDIKDIEALLKSTLKYFDLSDVIFNVIIVTDDVIHELNKTYRGIDNKTDVISFALEDTKDLNNPIVRVLGDIYLSIDTAREQAYDYYNTEQEEIRFLVIHGFLHLLGYDHIEETDEKKMMSLEEEVLINYDPRRKDKKEEF